MQSLGFKEGVEAARSLVEAQPKAVDAIRPRVSLALLLYGGKMRRAGSFRCPQLRFVRQQPPCTLRGRGRR